MVTLEQFRLFDEAFVDIHNTRISGKKDNYESNVESSEEIEERKFGKSLEECNRCTDFLSNGWKYVLFLRCSGGRRRSQKYVWVVAFRMKRKLQNEHVCTSVMVSTVVEKESRRVRNICVGREKRTVPNCASGMER